MSYIDFHVHIDFYDNPEVILDQYEQNKIYALFVTNLPELFQRCVNIIKPYKYVRLALGFHPEMVVEYDFNPDLFANLISKTNYIGEVGLDGSIKQKRYLEKQIEIFKFVTDPRFSRGRIISVHAKGCEPRALDILIQNNVKNAVFHWYSGKISDIKNITEAGYYFSVNTSMINSTKGTDIINKIPQDRLLFETDGPFCKFNKKIVIPELIPQMYNRFNELLNINFTSFVFENFKRLLVGANLERISSGSNTDFSKTVAKPMP